MNIHKVCLEKVQHTASSSIVDNPTRKHSVFRTLSKKKKKKGGSETNANSFFVCKNLSVPCSYTKPSKLEHPGPPFSHKTTGSAAGFLSETTKQQNRFFPAVRFPSMFMYLQNPVPKKSNEFFSQIRIYAGFYGQINIRMKSNQENNENLTIKK